MQIIIIAPTLLQPTGVYIKQNTMGQREGVAVWGKNYKGERRKGKKNN